jgi:hypothetical protein
MSRTGYLKRDMATGFVSRIPYNDTKEGELAMYYDIAAVAHDDEARQIIQIMVRGSVLNFHFCTDGHIVFTDTNGVVYFDGYYEDTP